MTDLFGFEAPRAPFRDIRNQRDSVAEEKATLCLQLGELCKTVPATIRSASIEKTRAWMHSRERAMRVLKSSRSSRTDLTTSIAQMRDYL